MAWAGARGAMGNLEMSREHFGAAVVVAGLLTASPIALGEVEEGSHAKTEISGYGGWDHFHAPAGASVVDSNEVADDNRADARNTRSSPPENDPVYAIIPPTTKQRFVAWPTEEACVRHSARRRPGEFPGRARQGQRRFDAPDDAP